APTLKLKGIYFAIVSLGLAIICRLVIVNLPESWAGGSYGINLGLSISPVVTFYYMLAVMVAALLTITWLAQSRLGKALRAIRDDDQAAEVMGVNVVATRLKAWMLSALFGALAGGVEAWYTNIIDPESAFQFLVTAKTVIYAIAGGLGTVTGPVVGAIVMVWIDDLIWQRFPIFNLFLLGLAIILLILFLPRGIVGSIIQRKPSWRRYIL
ncbi:MAG: branched-chain amino acid ABC transporter permease, partial [Oceanibaculum nanhaiense]|nr:branched-chain amino acid ABC transporter permease [Oceanibaculum nanhaiense]